MKRVLIGSDLQYPYLDTAVYRAFIDFGARLKVDSVVLNGDINDFYSVSQYDKDPARVKRLVDELAGMERDVLKPLRKALPKATIYMTEGNHEDRLRRYIWKNAPALAGLPGLTVQKLYGLQKYDIRYHGANSPVLVGKLKVMHGHLISKHSAATARAHFERHGSSILVGHSHRLGAYYKTTQDGVHGAWECGCLCGMDAEYINFPDWQQGWALVSVNDSGLFSVELLPVIKGRVVYAGKEWPV